MELLFFLCSFVMWTGGGESRVVQSGSSDKDLAAFPGVHKSGIPPILSAHHNRSALTAVQDGKLLQEGADGDRVPLPGLPFSPLGRSRHYPPNIPAWIVNKKERRIMGADEKKPSGGGLAAISPVAVRGVYWMDSILPLSPKKRTKLAEAEKWIHDVKTTRKVTHMEQNTECGRNYLVVFDDDSKACVKQRHNYDQIQGEIFAYFLADLLQMRHHLPPTVLSRAVHNKLFEPVIQQLHDSLSFDPIKPFIITKFVEGLEPVHLPEILQPAILNETVEEALISARSEKLSQLRTDEIRQFGDLIVFDYLIGHLDRLSAVNLDWNPSALKEPIHNLFQSEGNLLFIDNESGLFHGYRLLAQYDKVLQKFVKSNCIFNKPTVVAVKKLVENRNAGLLLAKMLQSDYPQLVNYLPGIGPKTSQILQKRLRYIYRHMLWCEQNHFLP